VAQAAERAPVAPPPPAHGDGRTGAAICALTGLAVGALAVVLGTHSTISDRYRTPILAAGIVWSGVSSALLCLIGGAWREMRKTAKTLVRSPDRRRRGSRCAASGPCSSAARDMSTAMPWAGTPPASSPSPRRARWE